MLRYSGLRLVVLGVLLAFSRAEPAFSQAATSSSPSRPLPHPVAIPAGFENAIKNGTRTISGRPGDSYWQQYASYQIDVRVDPLNKTISGSAQIDYANNSPDTLSTLVLELAQNMHAYGAERNEPAEVTGGTRLSSVRLDGAELTRPAARRPGYNVSGTNLYLYPSRPILPGDTVSFGVDWQFLIPQAGASERMGYSHDNLFYLAYWYPRMAVYDDVVGWHTDPFLSKAEFYSGFADYAYGVDVPEGWVVRGTGTLENPAEVLADFVIDRLAEAGSTDEIVRVVTETETDRATRPSPTGRLTWRFSASRVRDVAFSMTRASLWDATRANVGDRNGDGSPDFARVEALYRTSAPLWRRAVEYLRHSVSALSDYLGYPYPWEHMTSIEGDDIIGGGMEFPMMTLIGDYTSVGDMALYGTTAHEVGHMWVPMIASSDERRYGWMDEGLTTFHENVAREMFVPGSNHFLVDQTVYESVARSGEEGEIMRWSNYHYSENAWVNASYYKPGTAFASLRAILGEETFDRALREFLDRWAFKHPYPWDLWNTIEDVSGVELDWFWSSWFFETWRPDHAISDVRQSDTGIEVVIDDRGQLFYPASVSITLADGTVMTGEVPVEHWLSGAVKATVPFEATAAVTRVELDPNRRFPDIDRGNNVWPAPVPGTSR